MRILDCEEREGRTEKEGAGRERRNKKEDRIPLRCCLQRLYFSTQRRSKGAKTQREKEEWRRKKGERGEGRRRRWSAIKMFSPATLFFNAKKKQRRKGAKGSR